MKIFKKVKTNDVSYLFQAPNGVPGDISRTDETNVEPIMLQLAGTPPAYPQAFGLPVVEVAGGAAAWQTTNVAADFAGVLIREVPQQAAVGDQGQFSGTIPNPVQPQGLAVRGYVNVVCQYGTPARGGIVYINIQATGSRVVGGFEATSQAGYNVALTTTQATWAVDGVDAFGNAELRIAR